MEYKDIEKILMKQSLDLKPAPEVPADSAPFEMIALEHTETDNHKWLNLISKKLQTAKTFEIHCWNEETEWIDLALRYGDLKEDDWKYGKIVAGAVTTKFIDMLLGLPKPADKEICNKMTPFFQIFLDDTFQSCHYGTENYIK